MSRGLDFLILSLIAAFPFSGSAQTVYIGQSDTEYYEIDIKTIRKKPEYIQVWIEKNDSVTSEKSTSSKNLIRFRCAEDEIAVASTVIYSRPNGRGDVVSTNNLSYPVFSPIVPGSVAESFSGFVCGYVNGESWAIERVQAAIDSDRAVESAVDAADAATSAADAAEAAADAAAAAKDTPRKSGRP